MASLNSIQNSTAFTILLIIIITFLLHHVLCPVSCFNQPQHAPPEPLCVEKNRIGSSPPTCHNKCNQCHPCMAVQVPSVPRHDQVQPCLAPKKFILQGNRFSNYKPLSWKCSCGDHFFNP